MFMFRQLGIKSVAAIARAFPETSSNQFRVLTYHRVNHASAQRHLDPCTLSATPQGFADQMAYLAKHHNVVSIDEVRRALAGDEPLPERAVMISFDDAYRDFEEHAWPVLRHFKLPALLFVPSAFPNQGIPFWWDVIYEMIFASDRSALKSNDQMWPLHNRRAKQVAHLELTRQCLQLSSGNPSDFVKQLAADNHYDPRSSSTMSWESIRQLAHEGLDLGAHSRTHPVLSRMDAGQITAEITGSMQDILRETGYSPRSFAYPSGAYSCQVLEAVESAGVELAFTTCRGVNHLDPQSRFQLRRINVGRRATVAQLETQLLIRSNWINRFCKLQSTVLPN